MEPPSSHCNWRDNLHERESRHVGARLPLPETLHELLGERLTALSEGTKDALLLAASSSDPTLDLLGRALEADAEILEPAVDARIVEATEGTIRFAHPLFASAVYDAASTRARRHAHKRLAAASIDIEERARHLARSAPAPDPSVAAALDAAASAAVSLGAPAAAAELLEEAIAHLPTDDVDGRAVRAVDAAAALLNVGDRRRARGWLEDALTSIDEGPIRSDVLALLSELVAGDAHGGERRRMLIEQALREAGDDKRRRAEALLRYDMWERSQDKLGDALQTARSASGKINLPLLG